MKTVICFVLLATLGGASRVLADDATVLARVNGIAITTAQVDRLVQQMAGPGAQGSAPPSPEALHQEALQSLIDIEVLTQQARAEKIEVPPSDVDQHLNQIKGRYPTAEAFQESLTTYHATEEDLRREVAASLLMQKLVEHHVTVKLPPHAAEQFYKENPDKFQHPAEIRASHILFRVAAGGDADAVKKRAEDTLGRIKKGEDFAKLAKDLSEDPGSASRGGDLGFFSRDSVVPQFADAAFSLQKDQLSNVVQTQFGFHIIKVTDSRGPGLVPLADAKEQIEGFLEGQERDKQEHAYLDQLKKTAKIEVVESAPATPAGAAKAE